MHQVGSINMTDRGHAYRSNQLFPGYIIDVSTTVSSGLPDWMYNQMGVSSVICQLLYEYGFDITAIRTPVLGLLSKQKFILI